jgi:hypothetical protein
MAGVHVPDVAVGIYSRENVLLAKGYGFANVELGVAVRPASKCPRSRRFIQPTNR